MKAPGESPLDRLPHRPPFRFIHRVLSLNPGVAAEGVWEVRGDEEFFSGHFPGRPVVPGVLIGEALAQLSGLVGPRRGSHAALAHLDVRFRNSVVPPATIHLHSTLARELGPLTMYDVRAEVGQIVVAEGTLVLGWG